MVHTNQLLMRNYLLIACLFILVPGMFSQIIAIRNVNLIPMDGDYVRSRQTVLIEKGQILKIGEADRVGIPKRAYVIDGSGKYLIPGLMDMHVHFFTEQGISSKLLPQEAKIMLANGVTTARVMNGDSVYLKLRHYLRQTSGTELVVAGPQLVGKWPFKGPFWGKIVDTPEKARLAVEQAQQKGYDAVKVTFFVQADVYDTIVTTAQRLNMPVTGHVGPDIGLARALAAGQQIEHLDEFLEQLLPDSTQIQTGISGTGIWNKKAAWPTVAMLDESKIPALVHQIKESGIAVTPTHHFLHSSFATGQKETDILASPDFAYIPASLHADRFQARAYFWDNPPPDSLRKRYVELRQHLTRALYTAGIPLLCGSDSPEWFLVSGFAIHYELAAMVEAGLTPFAALETATVNPAKYLGIDSEKGTISEGKSADLILLNANPLTDITNTREISGVFCRGKYYDRKLLDRLLEEARVLGKQ